MESEEHLEVTLKRIAQWCFFVTMGISAVSLLELVFDSLIFANVKPDYVPIAPSSAVCFSILSVPLFFYVIRPGNSVSRRVASAAAVLTFSICLILLAGFFLGTTFEAERLGIKSSVTFTNVPTGHMSPITATTFMATALGVFLLVLSRGARQRFNQIAAFISMAVVLTGFVIVIGYLHGTPLLYGGDVIPVALPTAIAFMLIGLGLITASGPHVLPLRVFVGPTVRNRLMRVFLPAIILFVLIDGVMYAATFTRAANPALISALIALLSIIVVSIIISKMAKSIGGEIDHAHSERNQAEKLLKQDENRLEALLRLSFLEVEDEKELTGIALEECVRLTKSEGGYLHFFNEDQQTIQLYSWSKSVMEICTAVQDHHYPLDAAGVWADCIRLRKPMIVNDYQNMPEKNGYPEGHFHLVRHLGVPVFDGDQIVGVTGVGNKKEPYDESDVRQIKLFMHNLWGILKRRRLEEERKRLISELKGALDNVKILSGMLPICANCKKIRNDKGYWGKIESYILAGCIYRSI